MIISIMKYSYSAHDTLASNAYNFSKKVMDAPKI